VRAVDTRTLHGNRRDFRRFNIADDYLFRYSQTLFKILDKPGHPAAASVLMREENSRIPLATREKWCTFT